MGMLLTCPIRQSSAAICAYTKCSQHDSILLYITVIYHQILNFLVRLRNVLAIRYRSIIGSSPNILGPSCLILTHLMCYSESIFGTTNCHTQHVTHIIIMWQYIIIQYYVFWQVRVNNDQEFPKSKLILIVETLMESR